MRRKQDEPYPELATLMTTVAEHTMVQTLASLTPAPAERLPPLVGALHVGVTVWQLDNPRDPGSLRLVASDPAAAEATRAAWADLIGKRMSEVFPALVDTPLPRTYAELAQSGGVVELPDQRFADSRGGELVFAARAVGLPNSCVLVSFTNVAVERLLIHDVRHCACGGEYRARLAQLESKLAVVQQQQVAISRVEKLAAIGQLAASVGHELRNPLAAVRNATTYLSKRVLDSKWAAPLTADPKIGILFRIIERELNITGKIINDLLDYARERELVLQPCPLHPLVEEALGFVTAGPVLIHNRVPMELPLLCIDREQLRQALVNLIQNAVDAIPPGRPGDVVISAKGGDELPFQIAIKDNGVGIPAESVERIFEPLYTTKLKGTGLGLAIVKSIMKRHAGRVEVHSQLGLGSRFTLILPCPVPSGSPDEKLP